jgi:predicted ATP-binding protein involved in virulence
LQEFARNWAQILDETSPSPYVAARKQLLNLRIKDHQDIIQFFENKEYEYKLETRRLTFPPQPIKVIEDDEDDDIILLEDFTSLTPYPSLLTKYIRLERLVLKNYKCFDGLDLAFTAQPTYNDLDQLQQPWLLLLGENGVGKSSILKAITLALMGANKQIELTEYLNPSGLLKRGKKNGFIQLRYNDGEETLISFSNRSQTIKNSLKEPITNLIAYGSIRLLPKNELKPEKGIFDGVKVGNLFDYTISLENATQWLLNVKKDDFDKAAITIKDLMLLPTDALLVKDHTHKQIMVKYPDKPAMAIDQLSDGYRSIYALAVDIIATLSSENISYDLAEGIILIDEIETHLHPRWKMQVVERLRYAFPKLQFIVSTHEPLCLRGLQKDEAVVLRQGEVHEVVAVTDLPDPSKLRIDQILTSEFFGLKSTMDVRTEKIFEEYYSILAKNQNDRSPEEIERSFELNRQIARIKYLGNDTREDLVYYVIDELLAQQVKKDGMKMTELKIAALERVQKIWNTINNAANDLSRSQKD